MLEQVNLNGLMIVPLFDLYGHTEKTDVFGAGMLGLVELDFFG